MKISTLLKGLFFLVAVCCAGTVLAQTVTITTPSASTTSILAGQTVSFTSSRSGTFSGSGSNYTFSWSSSPSTGVSLPSPTTTTNTSASGTGTFSSAGSFSVTSTVKRGSGTAVTSAAKTINVYTVNAGVDQNIAPGTVSLSGSAAGGTGITSYAWTKTSGTGGTITSPSSAATTVTGLTVGTYVFRLTVNGLSNIFDEVTITVAVPTNPVGCNGQFYVSHGPVTGFTGNTLLEKLSFSGLTISPGNFALNPGGYGFNAMGINPLDGYIYAIRYPNGSGAKAHLLKIGSGGTANEVDLGDIPALANGETAYAACFDADGTFYFSTASGNFFKILNPTTSLNAILVASSGFSAIADIAINPVDGQMYGTSTANTGWLYKINKSTGVLTSVPGTPNLGGSNFFASLFFDEVGQMFGYRSDGPFYLINKTNGSLTAAGTGASYSGADGCSCSFGRVFHDLTGATICPTHANPNTTFNITVAVTNQSSSQKTGLVYTLEIPSNRFSFNESAATIASKLAALGLLPSADPSFVTISSTMGTNNKIVISSFQTGGVNASVSFTLQLKLVTLGGVYNPVHMQSTISGLPANMGMDLSNDPTTVSPDDSTLIDFCAGISLPVKLVYFKGDLENGIAKLTWQSAVEDNISGYIVERSYNGNDWTDLGEVASANKPNTYTYNDPIVNSPEKIYYRLKIRETAGFSYSGTVVIKTSEVLGNISVAPNPFRGTIQLSINSSDAENITYTLLNGEGKQLRNASQKLSRGSNVFFVNDLESLQTGVYFLQVQYNNEVKTLKLLKIDR